MTPTTMPALPSSVTPTMATTPEPTCLLPSSARLRSSLRSMPSTARAMQLHVADHAHAVGAFGARAPPPMASFFLRLRKLALEPAPLVQHLREARRHVLERHLAAPRPPPWRARRGVARICARCVPVSASIRRTPAATPLSLSTVIEADVAGARAHGSRRTARPTSPWCCRRPRPWRRRAPRRRISRRTARAPPTRCASSTAISRVVTGVFCSTTSLAMSSTRSISCRASSAWDGRNRSAAGRARPASPSARHDRRAPGAAPRAGGGWPNGFAGSRCGGHGRPRARAQRPTSSVPSSTDAGMDEHVARLLLGVGDAQAHARPRVMTPVSPTWPPDSP